jgi:curved DNA-binding protein
MIMQTPDEFIDYYEILQVSPTCDATALEAAYRHYAKMYHPDHIETADVTKFNDVISAYRMLREPQQRAKYDAIHLVHKPRRQRPANARDFQIDEKTALNDAEIHERILLSLYKKRRDNASEAGMGSFALQEMLGCSDSQFDFHIWYLKAKGFVDVTEQGTFAVTIQGIDHVISTSRKSAAEKLLIATSREDRD